MPAYCITYIKSSTFDSPSWQPSWHFASLFCSTSNLPLILGGQKCPFPPACRSRQRFCCPLSQQGFTDVEVLEWGPVAFPYTPNAGDVVWGLIIWWVHRLRWISLGIHICDSISTDSISLQSRPSEIRQGNLISCISEMIVDEGC